MARTSRVRFACFFALASVACGHSSWSGPTNVALGTPRTLIYVSDDPGVVKHGGGSGTPGVVHVFDPTSFQEVGHFDVGNGIGEAQATSDGSLVWFVASNEAAVQLVDTNTWDVFDLGVGVSPTHSFLAPGGKEIWVGDDGSADVAVISTETRSVLTTTLTGAGHHKVAFATDDGGALVRAYVSNLVDGTITPVGPDHVAASNVPGTGPAPHGIDYAASTKRVYNCSGDTDHDVEVIATTDEPGTAGDETNTIVARVPLPARCSFLRVSLDGSYADVTMPDANLFGRIRLADHALTTVPTGSRPDVFAHASGHAYVGNALESTVTVVDLASATVATTIAVGAANAPGSTTGDRYLRAYDGRVYVLNGFDGTVSVIDATTNAVLATLGGMHEPVGVAIAGPNGGSSYPR